MYKKAGIAFNYSIARFCILVYMFLLLFTRCPETGLALGTLSFKIDEHSGADSEIHNVGKDTIRANRTVRIDTCGSDAGITG